MKLAQSLFFTFFVFITSGYTQTTPDTLKVLFVGNSYTFFSNLPQMVSLISENTNVKLVTKKSVAGGATLSHHWRGERGLATKQKIQEGEFDIVVLQEQSMRPINEPDSFFYYADKFCEFIKLNGAQPYFYGTWAREKVPQYQETLTENYRKAATQNNCQAILVGEAWKLAKQHRPNIELYDPDGSHPSDLGAFLTACVFVEALTNEIPESLPDGYFILDESGESVLIMRLDWLDVQFCLKVVNEFVVNE